MRSDQTQAKLLAYLQSQADAGGLIWGIPHSRMSREAELGDGSVSYAVDGLIKAGELTLLVRGSGRQKAMYRLGAPKPEPVREYEPSGIESVVRHIPNRNWLGASDSMPTIEVSVARVRFLEGTRI